MLGYLHLDPRLLWYVNILNEIVCADMNSGLQVCAVLAAYGFKGRVTTVGVDLGTTFSVVAMSVGDSVRVVEDIAGQKTFPSIVAFLNGGRVAALHEALPYLQSDPENTIYNAKRFLGRSLEDSEVAQYAMSHPFRVVEGSHLSNFSKVGFELSSSGHPRIVSPEQVGIAVLGALKQKTAEFLGHDQVSKAVIAVPAKFSLMQRQATAFMYKSIGWKVVRVIEEPTAAAIAYDLHKKENVHYILVYDFGGGTLDVSLLFSSHGAVQVYSTDGDDMLGGSDFDLCLYDTLRKKIEVEGDFLLSEHGSKNTSADPMKSALVDVHTCTQENVLLLAEEVKIALSSTPAVNASCLDPEDGHVVTVSVSKKEFESACDHLFQRGLLPVHRQLDSLSMRVEDIDEVVLVGGTTRIPRIKDMLRELFGASKINDKIDPDLTIAIGAASVID